MKQIILILLLSISTVANSQTHSSADEFGQFSVSLTVTDIVKSYEFYQKIGFVRLD